MTILSPDSERLTPIVCAPWCEQGDGHVEETHPNDQWCYGDLAEISLSQYPLVRMSDDTYRREWVEVQLSRDRHGPSLVVLGSIAAPAGGEVEVNMLPAEARALAAALLNAAEVIES